jgi:hypothetical protein
MLLKDELIKECTVARIVVFYINQRNDMLSGFSFVVNFFDNSKNNLCLNAYV